MVAHEQRQICFIDRLCEYKVTALHEISQLAALSLKQEGVDVTTHGGSTKGETNACAKGPYKGAQKEETNVLGVHVSTQRSDDDVRACDRGPAN